MNGDAYAAVVAAFLLFFKERSEGKREVSSFFFPVFVWLCLLCALMMRLSTCDRFSLFEKNINGSSCAVQSFGLVNIVKLSAVEAATA